jgi:DNA-binding NtrC family response regulator
MKVLIVDDDESIRAMLIDILEHAGHVVVTAADATHLEAVVERERPAVVLLDVMMPGRNGFEALGALHRLWPTLPIHLMSAYMDLTQDAARKLGARSCHPKPLTIDAILAMATDAGAAAAETADG